MRFSEVAAGDPACLGTFSAEEISWLCAGERTDHFQLASRPQPLQTDGRQRESPTWRSVPLNPNRSEVTGSEVTVKLLSLARFFCGRGRVLKFCSPATR